MSPYFVVVFFSLVDQLFALFKFVSNSISDIHTLNSRFFAWCRRSFSISPPGANSTHTRKNEKDFVFRSLIRTFAPKLYKKVEKEE